MADHLTEEEQLETLKRWWKENGKSTIAGVVLAVAGYFGWEAWQTQQRDQAESSAALYEQLVEVLAVEPGQSLSEEQRANATHFVQQLQDGDPGSLYAKNAALMVAKLSAENDDLEQAAIHLRWILDNRPSDGISLVARVRLSRVLLAQAQLDEALALVEGETDPSFTAVYAEARGDVLVAMERVADARAAYQLALDRLLPGQSNRRPILQMKLDDLQLAAPAVASAEEAP
ncbi:tetratricopeptide repeat protein [Exilibacterium tricleocarpae]|uniref:Ancillary SecYEG translocon subunit n=1 Tax=Exilibacterium tricleocarpae TaxID=2591008 RepID=A0A545U8C6_9GAMM|nr:tetratricopeptide repeat protein [Exilibacterium tricleocarpae]TQV85725.1 tetratricopeptide repeat protein [Exilibacterium tricleocarpae]